MKPLVLGPGGLAGWNCLVSPILKQTLWEDRGPSSQARMARLSPHSLQGSLAAWPLPCVRCTVLFPISGTWSLLCPCAKHPSTFSFRSQLICPSLGGPSVISFVIAPPSYPLCTVDCTFWSVSSPGVGPFHSLPCLWNSACYTGAEYMYAE